MVGPPMFSDGCSCRVPPEPPPDEPPDPDELLPSPLAFMAEALPPPLLEPPLRDVTPTMNNLGRGVDCSSNRRK